MRFTRSIISTSLTLLLATAAHAQQHDHANHGGSDAPPAAEPAMNMDHAMSMTGLYGPYLMSREASGTSWQPDGAGMAGIHGMLGDWTTMVHGFVNTVYDRQSGPRGDRKTFSQSMLMLMAQRPLGDGTLGLRGMVSLDPAMGRSGYPLLFQTGETANGRDPLVDRQHPHDLFMELAGSYSKNLGANSSAFIYVGLPGEPALGPPAFMHRVSGMDNPEAPITHHWLDATHITYGVVTLGTVWREFKFETSAFNGREPDQNRWNIETRRFDSASARLSWNPSREWSLQVSHGRLASPEALEPNVAVRRTTASAIYDTRVAGNQWQTTLAWGRNRKDPGSTTDGWLLESAIKLGERHTILGRAERVGKDELFPAASPLAGQTYTVNKLSLGYVHDFARVARVRVGVGGVVSAYAVPGALDGVYGSHPRSFMVFMRAKLE